MLKESVDLLELLRKQADGADLDFLREAVAVLAQAVMDAEVSEQIGAAHGERSETRLTRRNGYRPRRWDTRVGTIELGIPKLREGSYFPSLLEPQRRSERALLSVVTQAYVEGVSTRRVDDLVRSLGCGGGQHIGRQHGPHEGHQVAARVDPQRPGTPSPSSRRPSSPPGRERPPPPPGRAARCGLAGWRSRLPIAPAGGWGSGTSAAQPAMA